MKLQRCTWKPCLCSNLVICRGVACYISGSPEGPGNKLRRIHAVQSTTSAGLMAVQAGCPSDKLWTGAERSAPHSAPACGTHRQPNTAVTPARHGCKELHPKFLQQVQQGQVYVMQGCLLFICLSLWPACRQALRNPSTSWHLKRPLRTPTHAFREWWHPCTLRRRLHPLST